MHADPLLELLSWKITVWSTCPRTLMEIWNGESPGIKSGSVLGPFSGVKRHICGFFYSREKLALLVSGIVPTMV